MNDGGMSDGHVVTYNAGEIIREVKNGIVLNVGEFADANLIDVSAQDGVVPNAGAIAQSHVADDNGSPRDINIFADSRFSFQECLKLLFHIAHAANLAWH